MCVLWNFNLKRVGIEDGWSTFQYHLVHFAQKLFVMRSLHEALWDPLWFMMLETYDKLQDFESFWTNRCCISIFLLETTSCWVYGARITTQGKNLQKRPPFKMPSQYYACNSMPLCQTATPVSPANHPNTSAKAERAQPRLSRNSLKHETLPHVFCMSSRKLATNSSPVERAKQKCWKKSELLLCLKLCCNYMKSLMCFCFVWLCFRDDLFQKFLLCVYWYTLFFNMFYSQNEICGHVDVNEMSVQCLKTTWPCNTIQNVDQTASVEDYKT